MKKLISILALTVALAGCNSLPQREQEVLIKYKYIVTPIPEEMLTVPPQVEKLDLSKADDKDLSIWMLDSEKRALTLESLLKAIREFQARKLKELEQAFKDDVIIKK